MTCGLILYSCTSVEFTGERYIPGATTPLLEPRLYLEHVHRYALAAHLARGRVLDLGSGAGYGSELLSARGLEVTALDLSVEALRFHLSGQQTADSKRAVAADCRDLPFTAGAFDFVACFELIEHVEHPERVLAEVARALRPGGVLAISSPNRPEHDAAFPGRSNPFHVREYDRSEFEELLRGHFPSIQMLGQRLIAGSRMVSDGRDTGEAARVLSSGVASLPELDVHSEPLYFVALCSTEELPGTIAGESFLLGRLEPFLDGLIQSICATYEEEVARLNARIRELDQS